MKAVRFVCLSAIVVCATFPAVLAAGQSERAADGHSAKTISPPQSLPAAGVPPPQSSWLKFAKAVTYSSGGFYASSIATGDVNGDGIPDVVVMDTCQTINGIGDCTDDGVLTVLLGNGNGTFQTLMSYSSSGVAGSSVAIGDLNGDGIPDLVVANQCQSSSDCDQGDVSVLLGNGDGTFQAAVTYSAGYVAVSVAIADVNGDGHADLVVANQSQCSTCSNGGLSVLLGNGDGTFEPPISYSSGGGTAALIVIGDTNGDGHPDLILANQCQSGSNCNQGAVSVLLGNGDGTFQAPVSMKSGGYLALSVAMGDVNGDGKPDLIVTNYCSSSADCSNGEVGVLFGKGNGTFQAPVIYSTGAFGATSVAIADVNGDGEPDLIVDNVCRTISNCKTGAVSVLLGNGNGTFQTAIDYSSGGADATSIAIGDVNGDGRPDVITANYCATTSNCNGTVDVLINKSVAMTTTSLTSSPNPSVVGQPVTFTATVSSALSIPDGEVVTFYHGQTKLGTSATTNGVASLTTALSKAATYIIKAKYPGDNFHKASSGTVTQVVNP